MAGFPIFMNENQLVLFIFQRFVSNEFPTEHVPSRKKSEFFPSLILNDALFELKLIDLPAIPFFPANTDVEWKEYRY